MRYLKKRIVIIAKWSGDVFYFERGNGDVRLIKGKQDKYYIKQTKKNLC